MCEYDETLRTVNCPRCGSEMGWDDTEPIGICNECIAAQDTEIAALKADIAKLLGRLECDTCNSGHKTLPLKLWDCPECTRLKHEAEIAKLREKALLYDLDEDGIKHRISLANRYIETNAENAKLRERVAELEKALMDHEGTGPVHPQEDGRPRPFKISAVLAKEERQAHDPYEIARKHGVSPADKAETCPDWRPIVGPESEGQ